MEENRLAGITIPKHIAIILDGNGRWAKQKNLPRAMGHKAGCETLEKTVENCAKIGVDYLTVYGFSTENWKRSEEEVSALMKLFRFYMKRLLKIAKENNVRVKMIGDKSRFAADIIAGVDALVSQTKDNTGMTFTFAINYGSRDELTRAVRAMVQDTLDQRIHSAEEVTEKLLEQYLDTYPDPDPDLLIRTSGELRLSNYLLWQIAYSEIYITDVLWPDFDMQELKNAVIAYGTRERRFGGR